MKLSEDAINYLEEHIPELAELALKHAYWDALATGSSVLISDNGQLIEVFPNGEKKFIKYLTPRIPITPGKKIYSHD